MPATTDLPFLARYATEEERVEVLSMLRHEVARRTRRAVMTNSWIKVCPTCSEAKRHDAYRRCATRPDGLDWRCRGCAAKAEAERRDTA